MKNKLIIFIVVVLWLASGTVVSAGKYPREPEKCGPYCQRKAEEAKQNREDRWDAYVAKAAAAAPYTPLAATYQTKILPGMIAAYQAAYAEDILDSTTLNWDKRVSLCAEGQTYPGGCWAGGTVTDLSQRIMDIMGTDARGDAYFKFNGEKYLISSGNRLYTMGQGNVPVIYTNGRFCTGWLGCWIKAPGTGDGNNGSGNGINPPPGWVPPPGFTPPPGWSPAPSPPPAEASITKFEITNFRLQQAQNGVNYYQVLKEQMAINHENYQLNLSWAVSGASSCTASCKYVKIDDYLQNQNFDDLQAQPWPCSSNIDNQTTFAGDVVLPVGTAKTKPKELGVIRYTLSCQGESGNDRKDLLVVVQAFQWFESIPILNSVAGFLAAR